ncbi:MAG: VCBS repeat-containing protein [Deltaproteobacteria bacterium]|nr:VCBS repeat-containing protein [Deltaproteobacteria bacterium]
MTADSHPAAWEISATADFNGDGKADILWRNTGTGDLYITHMDGMAVKTEVWIYNEADTSWHILGASDFFAEETPEIIWYKVQTGEVDIMHRNAGTTADWWYYREADLDWSIVGTGDFTSNTKADLLWYHAKQRVLYGMDTQDSTTSLFSIQL